MTERTEHNKVIIIGSGPAGLTAAIYAARAELAPLLLGGTTWGGQLMLTTEVGNYPGFQEDVMGPDLMVRMRSQAERFGAEIINKDVSRVDFSERPFKVWVGDERYQADAVILATGASSIWLGLPSEERLRGKGVSSCATCDGFFFKNTRIAVVGGGDSAMKEATFLTKFASEVVVIHRREELRASKIMQRRAENDPKISFMWNSEVVEVLGDEKVEGLKIKNTKTGKVSEEKFGGLFVAIGHKPNTGFLESSGIDLDEKGYVKVGERSRTSVEGVFAGGDIHDYVYRQAVTAAGEGCRAAMDAERWLSEKEAK